MGSSMSIQLPADHCDIGSAFCWNARMLIIAIVRIVEGQDMQPRLYVVLVLEALDG